MQCILSAYPNLHKLSSKVSISSYTPSEHFLDELGSVIVNIIHKHNDSEHRVVPVIQEAVVDRRWADTILTCLNNQEVHVGFLSVKLLGNLSRTTVQLSKIHLKVNWYVGLCLKKLIKSIQTFGQIMFHAPFVLTFSIEFYLKKN